MTLGTKVKVPGNRYVWIVRTVNVDGSLELYSPVLRGIICRDPEDCRRQKGRA